MAVLSQTPCSYAVPVPELFRRRNNPAGKYKLSPGGGNLLNELCVILDNDSIDYTRYFCGYPAHYLIDG